LALSPALLILAGNHRYTQDSVVKEAESIEPISVRIESREQVNKLGDALKLRVILRNETIEPIPLNTKGLKLKVARWYSNGGEGTTDESMGLVPEHIETGPVVLQVAGSLNFDSVEHISYFAKLDSVRIVYTIVCDDNQLNKQLPNREFELPVELGPSDLIFDVWTAKTDQERAAIQPRFNELLMARAKSEREGVLSFHKQLNLSEYVSMTINYMAGYAIPFLESAAKDKDPLIREQAVLTYPCSVLAIDKVNSLLDGFDYRGHVPVWAARLNNNKNRAEADARQFAVNALKDTDPLVRIAAVKVLTPGYVAEKMNFQSGEISYSDPEVPGFNKLRDLIPEKRWNLSVFTTLKAPLDSPIFELDHFDPFTSNSLDVDRERAAFDRVKALIRDADPGVRSEIQNYLTKFEREPSAAYAEADALRDENPGVRDNALRALQHSIELPSLAAIKRAFSLTKGKTALGLIPLLYEQEDLTLAPVLLEGFNARTTEERLAILTAVAGHADSATYELARLGLKDPSTAVQRIALMRLLPFPPGIVLPLLDQYSIHIPSELGPLSAAIRDEVESRRCWPFLAGNNVDQKAGRETVLTSWNGTAPLVSPDGKMIAYVETGYGRPGGSGGFGGSNQLSVTHIMDADGTNDRVVSDMSLNIWLADSSGVATSRDGYAAISNVKGDIVAEFGLTKSMSADSENSRATDWRNGDLREQYGDRMPHTKFFNWSDHIQDAGDNAAFSPDGRWMGPLQSQTEAFLLGSDDQRIKLYLPAYILDQCRVFWSPDNKFVLVTEAIRGQLMVIDVEKRTGRMIQNMDILLSRSPFSADSTHITFVRNDQVWMSQPDGSNLKQLTFDSSQKRRPVFSRDGKSIAYVKSQTDYRDRNPQEGVTDIWVLNIETGLATRVTAPNPDRIGSVDWLDDRTLIFSRQVVKPGMTGRQSLGESLRHRSSLRKVSLI